VDSAPALKVVKAGFEKLLYKPSCHQTFGLFFHFTQQTRRERNNLSRLHYVIRLAPTSNKTYLACCLWNWLGEFELADRF
jgi:hypothetical protein